MKRTLLAALSSMVLLSGWAITAIAQEGGTINTLSVNPRQNAELGNYTGTETGQPSDAVPGSQNEPNGLIPATTSMTGSGSDGSVQASQGASATRVPVARSEANPNNNSAQASPPPGAKPQKQSK